MPAGTLGSMTMPDGGLCEYILYGNAFAHMRIVMVVVAVVVVRGRRGKPQDVRRYVALT